METTFNSASALIKNYGNELDGSKCVQSEEEILSNAKRFSSLNQLMLPVLEAMAGSNSC